VHAGQSGTSENAAEQLPTIDRWAAMLKLHLATESSAKQPSRTPTAGAPLGRVNCGFFRVKPRRSITHGQCDTRQVGEGKLDGNTAEPLYPNMRSVGHGLSSALVTRFVAWRNDRFQA